MKVPNKFNISLNRGFSMVELLVVVAVILCLLVLVVGLGIFLPALAKAKAKAQRISCVNNLKQIGIATRIYATDNQDRFPWQVPAEERIDGRVYSGSADSLGKFEENWKHWQSLSNELSNPKVLRCPRDANRNQANSFVTKKPIGAAGNTIVPFGGDNGNLSFSYFVGSEADEAKPNNILAGDRNIAFGQYNNDSDSKGEIKKLGKKFTGKNRPMWTESLHGNQGDILLSDSSVQQSSDSKLAQYLIDSSANDNEILFPRGL